MTATAIRPIPSDLLLVTITSVFEFDDYPVIVCIMDDANAIVLGRAQMPTEAEWKNPRAVKCITYPWGNERQ